MNKLTRQQAINEKCKDCIYDRTQLGTWRKQTEDCIDVKCALFGYRPLTQETVRQNSLDRLNALEPAAKKKEIERRQVQASKIRKTPAE